MNRVRCAYCSKRAELGGIVRDGAYFCDDDCFRTALGDMPDGDDCPSCGFPNGEHMAGDCPGPSIA